MITENSFFRKIPAAISLEQRLIWEGAGWAIETISWSFDTLKAAASKIQPESTPFPAFIARESFACCWSIIDQCHMLRQMLRRTQPRQDGPTHRFLEKFEAVTLIRNAMDHLHQNIKNIANDKEPRSPLFGALSFCAVASGDLDMSNPSEPLVRRCRAVTLTAGALTHPQHVLHASNPAGRLIEAPVGLFEFEAFKHRVNFSDLINDLAALVRHYDTVVKDDQEVQLREFARKNELDEDKILGNYVGSLMITAVIEFDDPTNGVRNESK
jgi:hypothetical protein